MIDKFNLEHLRSLPIEGVAMRLGLQPTRHVTLCPFHDDRHPSLHFNVSRNTYKCYVCDASGGPIDLVMRYLNKPFPEACQWLADDSNIILSEYANTQTVEKKTYRFDASRYARYFERPYLSPEAKRFLFEERRLDERVIRWCRITSWTDKHGTPWLQTPYYDREGQLIGIQFRNLNYGLRSLNSLNGLKGGEAQNLSNPSNSEATQTFQTPRFKFPKGSKCSIYNLPVLNLLKPGEPLYIAEGCSDCWSLLSAGHKAIAIPSATTLHQGNLLKVLSSLNPQPSSLIPPPSSLIPRPSSLHIYPDQDIPGEKLYLQLTLLATQAGLPLVRHSLPVGCKDFSDYYLLSVNC